MLPWSVYPHNGQLLGNVCVFPPWKHTSVTIAHTDEVLTVYSLWRGKQKLTCPQGGDQEIN